MSKLKLTPAMLAAAYELLRTVPPFRGWKLPHESELDFAVILTDRLHGDCDGETIRISAACHGQILPLLETTAHEMVHLHQIRRKLETHNSQHNADFRRRAQSVCAALGFDYKRFV